MSVLATDSLGIEFDGVRAVDNVSFSVNAGEIFAIIGPNGAGKTTLFNLISGLYRAPRGKVLLNGQDVTNFPAHALAQVMKLAPTLPASHLIVMNMCGRGDKDVFTVAKALGVSL